MILAVADECAKSGAKEKAVQIIEMVSGEELAPMGSADFYRQPFTVARAAKQLSELGQKDRGLAVLKEAIKHWGPAMLAEDAAGTNRNIVSMEMEFSEILPQMAALGDMETAVDWAGKLRYHSAFENIATAIIQMGKTDEGVAVAKRAVLKDNVYYGVARELVEGDHGVEALRLMKNLLMYQREQSAMSSAQRMDEMFVWMMVNVLNEFKVGAFSPAESEMAASFLEYANPPFPRDWCRAFVE